jgi:short-subunit dehydrogenase
MNYKLKPLAQQVVVITGASSGIGLATALGGAARGAKLVLAARSGNTLEDLLQSIRASGGDAIHVVADVGHRPHVERIAEEGVRRFGRIDTWINNAGGSIYGRIEQVSEADNRRLFETNFWGVVHGSLVALPHLQADGGALINVGSEDAGVRLQGMYSASKRAVKGFTDALRIELIEAGVPVSVTLVQPTAVNTPFAENARNYMDHEPTLPAPQLDPRQVADAILGAAVEPERDVTVGMMARLDLAAFKLAPRLADWIARKQINRQQHGAPPVRPAGALYTAGEKGRVHGRPPEARGRRRPPNRP